jgi:hypothetical protein
MTRPTLTAVVATCLLSAVAHGQRPILHPEALAGPWELADTSGIDGFFLSLGTHARGTAEQPVITNQTVTIEHYRGAHAASVAQSGFSCYSGSSLHIGGGGGRRGGNGHHGGLAEEMLD